MKTKKRPQEISDTAENAGKKEQIGQPMLFPIFFCLSSGLLLILLKDLTMMITGYVLAAGLIIWGVWMLFQYFRADRITPRIAALCLGTRTALRRISQDSICL